MREITRISMGRKAFFCCLLSGGERSGDVKLYMENYNIYRKTLKDQDSGDMMREK